MFKNNHVQINITEQIKLINLAPKATERHIQISIKRVRLENQHTYFSYKYLPQSVTKPGTSSFVVEFSYFPIVKLIYKVAANSCLILYQQENLYLFKI